MRERGWMGGVLCFFFSAGEWELSRAVPSELVSIKVKVEKTFHL